MSNEQVTDLLKASIPYVTSVTSYFWRLTSPTKQRTVVRYAYLAAFLYGSLAGAFFVGKWVLVGVTALVLVAATILIKPVEDGASADLHGT